MPLMAEIAQAQLRKFTDQIWLDEIVPTLVEYIRIPNKSPSFEPDWEKLGHMDKAVELLAGWAKPKVAALGGTLSVERLPGRTPLILIDVPGAKGSDTVLLYGHLDKQPEMTGWVEGKGPWIPVLEGDKLYGRGGADDGYAIFGSLAALLVLKDQSVPRARAVIVIEASEESGSPDLPFYMEALADRIGSPSLVVCLDSGCGDYERLWLTTSLRGLIGGTSAMRPVSCRRASGFCGNCWRAWKTSRPAKSSSRNCTATFRPNGSRRQRWPQKHWAIRSTQSFRS
jgi:acetylornithine deacetylase/succinyl-diaminopimelate desuccinylase-like protein